MKLLRSVPGDSDTSEPLESVPLVLSNSLIAVCTFGFGPVRKYSPPISRVLLAICVRSPYRRPSDSYVPLAGTSEERESFLVALYDKGIGTSPNFLIIRVETKTPTPNFSKSR